MTEINNYTLSEFFKQDLNLINDYVNILQYVNPKKTHQDIFYMKLKDVEFIKQNINSVEDKPLVEIISKVQNIKESQVMNISILDFFGLMNSIKEQLEVINQAELNSLTSDHTNMKWEQVNGTERLQRFGIYNILDSLSGGNILKWDAIMELQYADVFTKLLMDKTQNDLQHEMQNIKTL